jgi:hypothetical protein
VVHAADVASGLLSAAARLNSGEILHLIDPLPVTRIVLLRRLAGGNQRTLVIPGGAAALSLARGVAGTGVPGLANAAYRLVSAGNPHRWTAGRATALGWRPRALAAWLAVGASSS